MKYGTLAFAVFELPLVGRKDFVKYQLIGLVDRVFAHELWDRGSIPSRGTKNGTWCLFVFNWNHFEMSLLNLRINFYLLRTFFPHLGRFCVVSSFTTFRPNFTSGLLQMIYRDLDASLFNIQPYKVRIMGKVVQSREKSCVLPNTLV